MLDTPASVFWHTGGGLSAGHLILPEQEARDMADFLDGLGLAVHTDLWTVCPAAQSATVRAA